MAEAALRGSCLCGTVSYEVAPPFQKMIHCHCSRCRKGTGTGHATNLIAGVAQFRWLSGDDVLARYDLPGAASFSKWFCSRCGSPLPRQARSGPFMVIPAGSLDTPPPLAPSDHIYWGSRAPWGCADGGLPTHDTIPDSWRAPPPGSGR